MKHLLLDRDGVLIPDRHGYDYRPTNVTLMTGVVEGLSQLSDWHFYVVSNQSAIGRGFLTEADVDRTNDQLKNLLAAQGITLTDCVYCPHAPDDNCVCRKPKTGMWETLSKRHGLTAGDVVMVGNRSSDIAFGHAIGCHTALVIDSAYPEDELVQPDWRVHDLSELATLLLSPLSNGNRPLS